MKPIGVFEFRRDKYYKIIATIYTDISAMNRILSAEKGMHVLKPLEYLEFFKGPISLTRVL